MTNHRTKIIATVGPAQDPPGALEALIDAGVDVLRINLSHASPREPAGKNPSSLFGLLPGRSFAN